MLLIQCPSEQRPVLLWPNHLESITATAEGHAVAVRCWCGWRGVVEVRRDRDPLRPAWPTAAAQRG
ncbi:MAG: hypothetical protein ACKVWR_17420 [Acidimicrobiales bacterium]